MSLLLCQIMFDSAILGCAYFLKQYTLMQAYSKSMKRIVVFYEVGKFLELKLSNYKILHCLKIFETSFSYLIFTGCLQETWTSCAESGRGLPDKTRPGPGRLSWITGRRTACVSHLLICFVKY